MILSDYPGYERGLARLRRVEDVLRAFAMTRQLERINGIHVRQLTPRHLDLLLLIGSPFLISPARRRAFRVFAQPEDVAQFLWIVSPDNPLDGSRPPENFFANLRPDEPDYFRQFYRAIDRYYDRAMLDRPAAPLGGRAVATSLSASMVNRIASAFSWKDEIFDRKGRPIPFAGILDMPVARLYQYWRWIITDRNPQTPLFSRFQDAFKSRVILKWRGRAKAAGFGDDVRAYLISVGKIVAAGVSPATRSANHAAETAATTK
jgi:hypothetical protein